ncbi:MAG: hypothetical protein IKU54_05090 [Oscillospiraceae bacterium]|nr:hypothetical protein [Oscillospiraceae bacterium]
MENVLFRQTLRGFDRQQVLEYIDNLSAQMSQQAEDYTNIQKDLEAEIQSLSLRLSENKGNLDISQELSAKLQTELDEIKQNNFELKRQINTYRNIIQEKDREISEIKINYGQLSEHNDQLETENAQWKARQDEIAACMVEANLRAKQIINQATAEAHQKKAEFDANAADLMGKVADVKGEISRLERQLEDSFAKLTDAMEKMDKASTVIEAQVKEYRTEVSKMDDFPPVTYRETYPTEKIVKAKALPKKTLTDSVLDTISKLLEK